MILAIDQGTTGSTAILFGEDGQVLGRDYSEFSQIYPQPSYVEHDANEIWQVTLATIQGAIRQAIANANIRVEQIQAIGITNQRETTVIWDKRTGQPVHNAIVWQCRRSTALCEQLKAAGKAPWIQQKTGLVVDAYFSATKIQWLFNHYPELKQRAHAGELAFGTIDSWIIWQLSGGKSHKTDHTNASRTMLYNIHQQQWDPELLALFDIPAAMLPQIEHSTANFGLTAKGLLGGDRQIPIHGVAGDQQAALFGQGCRTAGQVKNTYGTGCFMLMHTGATPVMSSHGLLTTIACDTQGYPAYALEGSVFMGGAAVQWLRDELQIIDHASQTQAIAQSINDSQGVYVVPAFTGLGAPYWNMTARGAIVGLTRGSGRKQIIRATLEAIAYQVKDVLDAMKQDSAIELQRLKVDGGACANDFLLQFQADLLNLAVVRPQNVDSTAIGAALLAGIGCGLWSTEQRPPYFDQTDKTFMPAMSNETRQNYCQGWANAVAQVDRQC